MYSASKIKSGNSKMAVRLLDDLDRTGRSLAGVYIESASLGSTFVNDHWVSLHPLSKFQSFGRHFLSLAVRHGVVEYIALKTNAGCLVQQPTLEDGAVQVHPLLLDAVFMPPDVDQDSLESVPDCDMIACLLNKGAKCNVLGQMDVWRIMVESMVEVIERDGYIQPWLNAIKQFKECGQKLPSIRNIELLGERKQWFGLEFDSNHFEGRGNDFEDFSRAPGIVDTMGFQIVDGNTFWFIISWTVTFYSSYYKRFCRIAKI
jgi:hypothetical protein